MIKYDGKFIDISGKKIQVKYTIRKIVEISNQVIILMYDDEIIANNIVSFDMNGNELWKINDILNVKRPTGNVDIQNENGVLKVHSSVGLVFKINVETRKIINNEFLR
ncbi:hypothetical protein Osc1_14580 [Hominimerdicola sp. 21CYCFAH17_S]